MYPGSALSYIASQYCLASMGRQMVTELLWDASFHPLGLYLAGREKQGDRFCEKNYKLIYRPGSVFRNDSALQTGRDQWSCMRANGLCWFTPAEDEFRTTWCSSSWEWAQLRFLSKCLVWPVQNVHAGGPDPGQQLYKLYKAKSCKLHCWLTGNQRAAGD